MHTELSKGHQPIATKMLSCKSGVKELYLDKTHTQKKQKISTKKINHACEIDKARPLVIAKQLIVPN